MSFFIDATKSSPSFIASVVRKTGEAVLGVTEATDGQSDSTAIYLVMLKSITGLGGILGSG